MTDGVSLETGTGLCPGLTLAPGCTRRLKAAQEALGVTAVTQSARGPSGPCAGLGVAVGVTGSGSRVTCGWKGGGKSRVLGPGHQGLRLRTAGEPGAEGTQQDPGCEGCGAGTMPRVGLACVWSSKCPAPVLGTLVLLCRCPHQQRPLEAP